MTTTHCNDTLYLKQKTILYRIIYVLFFTIILSFSALSQGLKFYGNNELIANRTSYEVFHEKGPVFQDYLTMTFDLSILDPTPFGFIFHIVDLENNTYYNLTHTSENSETSLLKLNFSNQTNLIEIVVPKSKLGSEQWHKFSVVFDAINNNISITFLGQTYRVDKDIEESLLNGSIFFGKYNRYIDLPDMAIRNLNLFDNHQKFAFVFNEIEGSVVHADNNVSYGYVENPYWLINDSYYWKQIGDFEASSPGAVSFDAENQQFVMVTNDTFISLDVRSGELQKTALAQSNPLPMKLGMSFWDTPNNTWVIYELDDNQLNKPAFVSFNIEKQNWKILSYKQFENIRHHHVGIFDPQTQQYLIFGGYGNGQYLNDFSMINLNKDQIQRNIQFTGDTITPRFFSGITQINRDELILFGGAGNPSGDQSLGKVYYTNSYLINVRENKIKELWELPDFEKPMVSVREMILSRDSAFFYTLYYPEYVPNTHLKLYKFSVENGNYEIVGDSIPMNSERIETNANLYLNRFTDQMYCVTQEYQPDGSSGIKIYSISYPPVSGTDFFKEVKPKALLLSLENHTWVFLLLLFVFITAGVWYYSFIRKKRKDKHNYQIKRIIQHENTGKSNVEKRKINAMYLFGEFCAFDNKGHDVSHLFSPKIKQLFFLILFKSKEKGVSSYEIYDALWPDKPKEKAKNSKGVTLNQLRKILQDFDGIELLYENKNLHISTTSEFYCDYIDFWSTLEKLQQETITDPLLMKKLVDLLSLGPLLACTDYEYFDQYKQLAENEILNILPASIEMSFKNEDYHLTISCCKIMLSIDSTHEPAFHFLIASYASIDFPEKARKRYNSFLLDFKKETGNEYPYTFKELYESRSLRYTKEQNHFL